MNIRIPASLHKPLTSSALLLFLAGSALGLSFYVRQDQTQALAHIRQALSQTRLQLQQAKDETARSQLARSRLDALDLTDADTIASFRHDALRRLQSDPRLFSVELTPTSRASAPPSSQGLPTRAILHLSLRAGVLHEEALTTALQSLNAMPGVHVIPRGCDIVRSHATRETGPVLPPLQARCQLDWLTLHSAAGAKS
jgi:hypothetical protein